MAEVNYQILERIVPRLKDMIFGDLCHHSATEVQLHCLYPNHDGSLLHETRYVFRETMSFAFQWSWRSSLHVFSNTSEDLRDQLAIYPSALQEESSHTRFSFSAGAVWQTQWPPHDPVASARLLSVPPDGKNQ